MGFWDVVKSVALSAKCSTGWHAGEWSHVSGKPQCFVEKTCPDCHKHVTTNKHTFGEWRRIDYSSCNSVRECTHCSSSEQKIIHEYQNNGKDENCRIIEKCQHCGGQRMGRTDHEWIKIFDHEVKVGGSRKCKRCGATD